MAPLHTAQRAGQLLGPLQAMIDDALPLISQILSPGELGGLAAAIRGGHSVRRVGSTVPWALTGASPGIRQHVLTQLPAPARLLYRTIWLRRPARTAPAL